MGALAPGAVIGNCRIEGVVGRGGMGVVYRAVQLDLDREVALKVVAPALTGDPEARARFLAEARAAAAVDHPAVVPVHAAGEYDGAAYLVMRFVRGDDLRTLVRRDGPLSPDRAAFLIAQLGEALDAIHGAGYVHRDVKPQNVLLDEDGHVYLSDFGVAKALAATHGETVTDHWVGTLDYVAPEQIRGQTVDARADVYALGGVLHFMLTGSVPFPRESDEARLWAHLHDPPPRPSSLAPHVPATFDGVVAAAMAKDASLRYASAGALGRAAQAAARGDEAPTRPMRRTQRQSRRLWPAAVGLIVAAAAAATLLPRDHGTASPDPTPTPRAPPGPSGKDDQGPRPGPVYPKFGKRPRGVAVAGGRVWVISHGRQKVVSKAVDAQERSSVVIGYGASDIAADGDIVWITNERRRTLIRLDARTRDVQTFPVLGRPVLLAIGRRGVWIATQEQDDSPGALQLFDGSSWSAPIPVEQRINALAYGDGHLWVALEQGEEILRLESTGRLEHAAWLHEPATELTYGAHRLWAALEGGEEVERIDPVGERTATISLRGRPAQITLARGKVFVVCGTIHRLAVFTLTGETPERTIDLPDDPYAITSGGGHLWVTSLGDHSLARIDW